MKKKQVIFCMSLGVISLFTSCTSGDPELDLAPLAKETATTQDDTLDPTKGKIVLNLNPNASFIAQTRALSEDSYRNTDNYTVQVFNNDSPSDLIVNCKFSELDSYMPSSFQPGNYTVKAFYGTEENYSRNSFYVEGVKNNVSVIAGSKTNVQLTCTPTCGKLSVVFDGEMSTYYSAYEVKFSQAEAFGGSTINWSATDTEPYYVKLNAGGETLRYTINVTAKDEYTYTDAQGNKKENGTVSSEFQLERNRAYKLTVKPDYTAATEGGLKVIIEIDEGTNPIDVSVVVPIEWL